jgi:hypothetical protein
MAGRFGGITYAVTFDGLAYAFDEIRHNHPNLAALLRRQPELDDLPAAVGFSVDIAIVKQVCVMVDVVDANATQRSLSPSPKGQTTIR